MKVDEQVRNRIVALIEKGGNVLSTLRARPHGVAGLPTVSEQAYKNWETQALAFLTDFLGPDHTYTSSFRTATENGGYEYHVHEGIGILEALLEDVDRGYIGTVRNLITAEVWSDLFDQAVHLLDNGYNAPAASLAGALLENGLRSVAGSRGVPVRDGDSLPSLNQKLAQKGVYNRLTQKKVSIWTDVRNAADHGRFDEVNDRDVDDLVKGAQILLGNLL